MYSHKLDENLPLMNDLSYLASYQRKKARAFVPGKCFLPFLTFSCREHTNIRPGFAIDECSTLLDLFFSDEQAKKLEHLLLASVFCLA